MIKHPSKPQFNFYFLSLIFILILAVFIRLRGVVMGYFAFTFDPGRDLLAVKQLVVDHKVSLIGPFSGLSGVFYGPWWYWILSIPFIIGGGDPRVIAGFIALANILVPVGLYLLGRKAGSEFAGLVGATFAAFSPLLIGYSVQIWNPNLVPPLVMGVVLLLYEVSKGRTLERVRSSIVWLVLGLLLGFIINFQISFGLALVFSLLPWFVFMLLRHRATLVQLFVCLVGVTILFFPLFIFDVRHNFLETKAVLTYLRDRPIRSHDYNAFPLITKLIDRSRLFKSIWLETFIFKHLAVSILGVVVLSPLYLMGQKKTDPEHSRQTAFIWWIVLSMVLLFAFFMWYPDTVWNYYLVGLPVLYLSVMTLAVATFSKRLAITKKVATQSALLVFVLVILFPWSSIPEWMGWQKSWEGDGSVFRNQLAILDYIYHDVGEKPLNIMVYTPPIYDFHYQYLFWWYGGNKYGRVPGGERTGNLYLIMEPNKDAPWLWEGWIKTVVLDPGKVISRKEFPGGVVVEKRVL